MVTISNSGYAQSLYFANEDVYGSTATVDQAFGLVQSVNPTETNNFIKVRTMGGTRDYSNVVTGKFEVSGSMDFYLQGGNFVRMALGEDTGTTSGTVDGGPRIHTGASYVHVMGSAASPAADCFPSFTMEFADDEDGTCNGETGLYNLNRTYVGCRVNNLSISASVDEPVSVSCDWIAQTLTVSTAGATSVSDATTDPYVFYQGAVYATSGIIAYNTAIDSTSQIAEVNSFDLSVANNLEPVWYISGTTGSHQTTRGLKSLLVKGRDYDANLNLHFADKDMYQKFLGAASAKTPQDTITKFQVVVDFVRSGTIGSSPKVATDDYMRVVLEECAFNDINISGSPEDIIGQTISVYPESAKFIFVDTDVTYKS